MTLRLPRRRARDQRGTASVESVLLIPAVLLVLALMVAGFRIWDARSQVGAAAESAARAASLSPTASAARVRADQIVATNLDAGGFDCGDRRVSIDTSGFSVRVGRPAQVSVTVTCTVTLSDLLIPGMPGQLTLHHSGSATLDRHRVRGR